jgi:hypothetical protein
LTTQIANIQQMAQPIMPEQAGRNSPPMSSDNAILLFGVDEDKCFDVWYDKVEHIIQFIAGRPVEIVDMFRLGRYEASKVRPVLVKLHTTWDCRVLVNGASKLRNYDSRVYLVRHEPLEVRRENIMEKLRLRAISENKVVSVQDDTLIVNGITVYSLSQGRIDGNTTDTHGSV